MRRAAIVFFVLASVVPGAENWREEGVIYLAHTPEAAMNPVPVHAVEIGQGFWYGRRAANVERSIPTMFTLLDEHGIVENFRNTAAHNGKPHNGPLYTDSDLYKWMEAAAWSLQSHDDPALRKQLDSLTATIASAQEPSGYVNTYWSGERASERFTQMYRSHELYCLGHLLQAGIAYYRSTGNSALLDIGRKFADYLVADFGPAKRPLLTGHPELEMALVELYRTTGEKKYLGLAGYLLSGVETERLQLKPSQITYLFSGVPFTSRTALVGHAVRAMYASSGATDYYAETRDAAYRKTLDTLWTDLTMRKMYITGGVGARAEGESFGAAYELPNDQAYGESCAAIGNMMWNFRLLQVTGEEKYADVMERALYNGVNSGMSLDGTLYCYRNPLASMGEKIRNPWYETTCCPPNLERVLASLPGYFYSTSKDGVWVHLYHNSRLDWHLENGTGLKIEQQTEYPWKGDVTLVVSPEKAERFTLRLRIPSWAKNALVEVNGAKEAAPQAGTYAAIAREWKAGDKVALHLPMETQTLAANPRVESDYAKVAVERGPLIYCLEAPDHSAAVGDLEFAGLSEPFEKLDRPDLLQGVVMLEHKGSAYEPALAETPLYLPWADAERRAARPVELKFIPYYAWANRGTNAMEVWVPLQLNPRTTQRGAGFDSPR